MGRVRQSWVFAQCLSCAAPAWGGELLRMFPDWWLAAWGVCVLCWGVMLGYRALRWAVLVPVIATLVCVLPYFIAGSMGLGERAMPALMLLGVSPVVVFAVTVVTLLVVGLRGRGRAGDEEVESAE